MSQSLYEGNLLLHPRLLDLSPGKVPLASLRSPNINVLGLGMTGLILLLWTGATLMKKSLKRARRINTPHAQGLVTGLDLGEAIVQKKNSSTIAVVTGKARTHRPQRLTCALSCSLLLPFQHL